MERVQKIISNAGIVSRRKAEELIARGRVLVNGAPVRLGMSADPEKDVIVVNGKRVRPQRKKYLMLHKPRGFVTTVTENFGMRTVMELLRAEVRDAHVYPVGRLDRDASGLLILTNDGEFANRVLHPSFEVAKVYLAELDSDFGDSERRRLEKGVVLDEKIVRPRVRTPGPRLVEVTVHEGMHKVVKRLFKELGYRVRGLTRIKVGPVRLDILPGKYRALHDHEIAYFYGRTRQTKDVHPTEEERGTLTGPEQEAGVERPSRPPRVSYQERRNATRRKRSSFARADEHDHRAAPRRRPDDHSSHRPHRGRRA